MDKTNKFSKASFLEIARLIVRIPTKAIDIISPFDVLSSGLGEKRNSIFEYTSS